MSNSAQVQFDILKRFPMLVPLNLDFTNYVGFLEAKSILFGVSITVPKYPSSSEILFNCEWKLSELLNEYQNTIEQWSNSGIPFNTFLDKLHALIVSCLETDGYSRLSLKEESVVLQEQVNCLHHYSSILLELKELGTDNLVCVSSDFQRVSLSSQDRNGSEHTLNLKLSNNLCDGSGKHSFEVVDTDLPETIVKIIQKSGNVTKAFRCFCDQINSLCAISNSLLLLDEQCWVIDPVIPRKADMYRRIYISWPRIMAQLSWDPLKPNQPPEIKFQGADAEVDALRCIYEKHLENWDQECSIIVNLCSVLQLQSLPQPPAPDANPISQTVETGECNICYTIQSEGKLPDESCGKCLLSFHTACLYEWLEMISGSRQVHGHISGPCPNCESTMKCPCPHALL